MYDFITGSFETYIFGQGARARAHDKDSESCPYPEGILKRKWLLGWNSVDKQRNEKKGGDHDGPAA